MKVGTHLKIIFSSFCFFIPVILSCQNKYSPQDFAYLMRSVKSGSFSELLPLTNKKMKSLLKTDEASVLCIGLHLYKNDKAEEAKDMFKFGVLNCKEPFKTICYEKLYYVSSDEEKIELLDEKIKNLRGERNLKEDKVKENQEKIEKLQDTIKDLFFFTGQFERLEDSLPVLFSIRAINQKVLLTYDLLKDEEIKKYGAFEKVMKMRFLVYEKKYNEAYEIGKYLLQENDSLLLLKKYVFYDLLRALLFGSKSYEENANLIKDFLVKNKKLIPIEVQYLAHLYIARLYEKCGKDYYKATLKYYDLAVKEAPSPYDFDDSNWYKLSLERKIDFFLFLKNASLSLEKWNNHDWYEDLVSRSIVELVSKKHYKTLKSLYNFVEKTKLEDQKAKLKYILARVGMIEKKKAYQEIYKLPHDMIYYTLLSAYKLNLPIKDALYKRRLKREANSLYSPKDAMKILHSYVTYGLCGYIYKEAMRIYPTITVDEAFEFSKELRIEDFLQDSINLMQFAINSEGAKFNEEHLRAVFPRPYYKEVNKWVKEYNLPEYLMYSLIRNESFFRASVISHAGAVGLAQLMPSTAKDIARVLKIKKYEITNPDTNVHFGSYYLSKMIDRFEGRFMPGICSYNAGPIAVSRWLKNSTIIEEDIFVETIPYDETRNYGKRLLSVACMYAYLYYNKKVDQVIKEIYQNLAPIDK